MFPVRPAGKMPSGDAALREESVQVVGKPANAIDAAFDGKRGATVSGRLRIGGGFGVRNCKGGGFHGSNRRVYTARPWLMVSGRPSAVRICSEGRRRRSRRKARAANRNFGSAGLDEPVSTVKCRQPTPHDSATFRLPVTTPSCEPTPSRRDRRPRQKPFPVFSGNRLPHMMWCLTIKPPNDLFNQPLYLSMKGTDVPRYNHSLHT